MSSPEERERITHIIGELKRKHPCPCTVQGCPFKGTCCICIRNHLADNTLPACCLPPVPERDDTEHYPDCRTPLLWLLYYARYPSRFREDLRRLSPKLREEVLHAIEELYRVAGY